MNHFLAAKLKFHIPRIVLAAVFIFAGLNGLFEFIPGTEYSTQGQRFIDHLKQSGFVWPAFNILELTAGGLLLFRSSHPIGVLVLIPVTLAIVLFHWFLSPQGAALGYLVFFLEVFMIIAFRKNLERMFFHKRHHLRVQDSHSPTSRQADTLKPRGV